MKAFLEEYGLVIVAIIVVSVLIGIAVYFGSQAKTSTTEQFNQMSSGTKTITSTAISSATSTMNKTQTQ